MAINSHTEINHAPVPSGFHIEIVSFHIEIIHLTQKWNREYQKGAVTGMKLLVRFLHYKRELMVMLGTDLPIEREENRR